MLIQIKDTSDPSDPKRFGMRVPIRAYFGVSQLGEVQSVLAFWNMQLSSFRATAILRRGSFPNMDGAIC